MFSIKKLYEIFFDFLFPKTEIVKRIESLGASEFKKEARVAEYEENLAIKDIHPLFRYRDPIVKESIWQLKYKGNKNIAKTIGIILYEEIIEDLSHETLFHNFQSPLLIPIPISKKRFKKRGYNQTELLGDVLRTLDNERTFHYSRNILKKVKETAPQTIMKDKRLRLKNLRGCFEVEDKNAVKGKNIILLDDVVTTGSTLDEAKITLETAGARRVISFTIAH